MKRVARIVIPAAVALSLVGLFGFLLQGKQIDVLNPSGEIAQAQRELLMFTLLLSSLVVVPVFTMLAYFSIKYRASNKRAKYTPDWGENKWLEGLWRGIPIVIIGVLGVLTYHTSHSLDPYKPLSGGKAMEVQVVALRWKWLFLYPEYGVATLNHLPIPLNKPVRFEMTADAPMSAFWIPALGSQVYAMNGMSSQLNLKATSTGDYMGYTTNINGEGYSDMTFTSRVMTDSDFSTWVETAKDSDVSMDIQRFKQLTEPKSESDERTYRLTDPKLFQYIMSESGGGHGHNMGHSMEMSE